MYREILSKARVKINFTIRERFQKLSQLAVSVRGILTDYNSTDNRACARSLIRLQLRARKNADKNPL